ncbi:unnamed protein product [Vicia faba]|uniref:Uncharacterized protein n=1 Tax=Vicia faba TaxID=3906 RepID=A0AAV1AIW7_VICFA|nr:unnamed protein product [Vicia faba]
MEEEKAAAYYDELTRKGEGAAKFKQGLGFSTSSSNDVVPKPGSALASSSSFLSQFVKASSSSTTPSDPPKPDTKSQLQSIQNKLKKKPTTESRVSESRDSDRRKRRRSRSRSRDRYRDSRRRSRSRERYTSYRDRDRSRSDSDGDRGRDRRRRRERERGRRRSRSVSPGKQRRSEVRTNDVRERGKGKNVGVDYAKLIEGYDNMAPAERVKAKMKLQLSETAARDTERGVGWERFEFNKDAPLDDEEIEVAEDDASLVKHIGQSFRFSSFESKREEQIQAAHDEAMFGATAPPPPTISTDSEPERENEKEVDDKKDLVSSLLSETVLAKQKGSWRDRVRQA